MFSAVKVRRGRARARRASRMPTRTPRGAVPSRVGRLFKRSTSSREIRGPSPLPLRTSDPGVSLPFLLLRRLCGAPRTPRRRSTTPQGKCAVPQGREGAPSVLFSACKNEKYHPGSNPSGYKQWFRRLRAAFRPSVLKEGGITAERLEGADILVLGAQKFSVAEFDALKDFIHDGGSAAGPRRRGRRGSPGHQHQLSHRGIRHQYQQRQSGAHGAPSISTRRRRS